MENITFDRNYELTSEDNGYADAIYEKAMEPDGFFASFGKKMDAIPKHTGRVQTASAQVKCCISHILLRKPSSCFGKWPIRL